MARSHSGTNGNTHTNGNGVPSDDNLPHNLEKVIPNPGHPLVNYVISKVRAQRGILIDRTANDWFGFS